jgi:C4-dicarboxylate-specific signal transduction histidine kinase
MREALRRVRLPAWAWPLLALPVVAGVDAWTYRAVAAAMRGRLEASLQTTLLSSASALGQWLDDQAALAEVMAADPRVREDVQELIAVSRRTAGDPAALKAAPAQARLREVLAPVVSRQENAGFFVLAPGGLILARIVDERVGERVVLSVADAVARVRDASGAAIAVFAFRIHPTSPS